MTVNRSTLKKVINERWKAFEERRIEHSSLKQALQKQNLTSVADTLLSEHICNICSRVSLFKAGLACYMKSNDNILSKTRFTNVL